MKRKLPNKSQAILPADFFEMVYQVVRLIPRGRVTNYGSIAKYLGASKSSRLVGYAMNNSHHLKNPIPAHRVVNRNGLLTGKHHFSSPTKMQELLESEGIKIKDDKILNLPEHFWDPEIELSL